jgi:hypothetical protein
MFVAWFAVCSSPHVSVCCSMEPIDRIHFIQKERWELLCVICRQRMGAKIQCHECYQVRTADATNSTSKQGPICSETLQL